MNYAKILVPIDFSPSSHQALEAAMELAEKYNAELYLLHVAPQYVSAVLPEGISHESITESGKKLAIEHFATSKAALDAKGFKVQTSVEISEDVAGGILDAIEREHADLLVVSTHGLSGWYPQVFGSIAEKLVRLAQCQVLLLRTPKPESSAKVRLGRMMEWW